MVLGSTTALWGLLGMLIPLLIHLLSKQKQQEIHFGSIQFLEETASDRSRSIQLSQYLLLAARMLIVGLITMLGAQLFLNSDTNYIHKVFVPQELVDNTNYSSLMAKYDDEAYEVLVYDHDINADCETCIHTPTLNTLLLKADQLTDSSTVMSFGYRKNIQGTIPKISRRTSVIQIPEMGEDRQRLIAIGDTLYQIKNTDLDNNVLLNLVEGSFSNERKEITICINGSVTSEDEVVKMQKIVSSITDYIKYPVQYNCDNPDWIIAIDTIVSQGQAKMIHWNVNNDALTWTHDGWSNYNINGIINTVGLRSTNLPVLMAEVFSSSLIGYDDYDDRIINLTEELDYSLQQVALADVGNKVEVSQYLWLLLLLALYGERRLSNQHIESV